MIGDNDEIVASQRIDLHRFLMYASIGTDILHGMFTASSFSFVRMPGVLTATVIAVLIAGCGGDGPVAPPTATGTAEVQRERPTPFVTESGASRVSAAVSSIVESPTALADTEPAVPLEDDGPPSGALAFFYRVNFGSETES